MQWQECLANQTPSGRDHGKIQAPPHNKPLFDCDKRRFAPPQPTSDGMFIAVVTFWNGVQPKYGPQ